MFKALSAQGVSLENSLLVGFKGLDREGFGWGIKGLAVTLFILSTVISRAHSVTMQIVKFLRWRHL